ncbi:HEAT repeat domain-containing protein [Geitlerinema sp. PCC 7407]|uniref:HEAT repeat domain-containing protein n=1 Tax=Geitlerinema sp. PCC 7407 TaxID=1173025 RepID=UPI00029FA842|nr:HEAT repeat domain-containing protein [Geitlerinema sp. PCC 7407]AFY67972.1 PBS lyase HEAT domain protein repeat-containing protein [Geitlerinema sp. PCC 7407]
MTVTHSAQTMDLIQAVEQADSPERLVAAVRALVASQDEANIPTLIKVLGYNNPAAAVLAVDGLVAWGQRAIAPTLEQLDDYNYGARAYSFRALSAIADPQALDALLSAAATDFAPSVRRAAAKGLGQLRWSCLSSQERSARQTQTLQVLESLLQDSDWSIRYAAIVGLQGLMMPEAQPSADLREQIQAMFERLLATDGEGAVKARVLLAQRQLTAAWAADLDAATVEQG